jgi:hypothetical protein
MASLLLLTAVAVLVGCGGDGASGPTGEVGADPSFAGEIQPIFTSSCASLQCHGAAEQAGLKLTAGDARAELVDVPSTSEPAFLRVATSDADTSYVIVKLEGDQSVGGRMPLGGQPLVADEIQLIRNWIDEGAKDN